ncbi:MAG: pirin family protein [Acidiferrobacterales bacterium]
MRRSPMTSMWPLDFQWQTADPFLFCVHHQDSYPKANALFGPQASLAGREIGNDFVGVDGWRMYHGTVVPGFPMHPHRGFETVTLVRTGLVDHADSLGAAGRYGSGDVQWLTAGQGVQHSEMFPLLNPHFDNPLELFQIWLNLPAASKMAEPHFRMFWRDAIPKVCEHDAAGRRIEVELIAGALGNALPLPPPPDSWAAGTNNHVAIWLIRLESGARWVLPESLPGINRTLYFHSGEKLRLAGDEVPVKSGMTLNAAMDIVIENGNAEARLLLLQGRPIAEPVASYGPFVMNSRAEIEQAFADYRRTRFGGWPWPRNDQVHEPGRGRFARHVDGRLEEPGER